MATNYKNPKSITPFTHGEIFPPNNVYYKVAGKPSSNVSYTMKVENLSVCNTYNAPMDVTLYYESSSQPIMLTYLPAYGSVQLISAEAPIYLIENLGDLWMSAKFTDGTTSTFNYINSVCSGLIAWKN
jgi:hypothetical protein